MLSCLVDPSQLSRPLSFWLHFTGDAVDLSVASEITQANFPAYSKSDSFVPINLIFLQCLTSFLLVALFCVILLGRIK